MTDPLTAFAVAGNALQFVQLGVSLVQKTTEYSSGGGSNEHATLRQLSQRLTAASEHLHAAMESNLAISFSPGSARALWLANEECLGICKKFLAFIDRLGLNHPQNLWRNVKLAFRTITTKPECDALCRAIEHARSNLILSLMVYLQDSVSTGHQDAHKAHEAIVDKMRDILGETCSMKADVQSLGLKLRQMSLGTEDLKAEVESTLNRHKRSLEYSENNISEDLLKLNKGIESMSQDLQKLTVQMDRELVARKGIIASLCFRNINARRHRVARAHSSTYQWIFRRNENSVVVWDDFMLWFLNGQKPIYWISGKPGSGKSTLMKELDVAIADQPQVASWLDGHQLLKASFYFWLAGAVEEKSMMGFLKSLTWQLLTERPELMSAVVTPRRWAAWFDQQPQRGQWEEDELKDMLHAITQHTLSKDRILLLLDGLDEYDGSDDDRDKLIEFINALAQHKHVKICVSSRPWNIFKDRLWDYPQLRLEDLTKDDIRQFVYDKLSADPNFQRQARRGIGLLDTISRQIVEKAQGVFLWVHLAVRDLLRVLRDGGRPHHILQELNSIPPDLDDYFSRIMTSIDPRYRREASVILQTSICSMDFTQAEHGSLIPGSDFLLMHLHFLEAFENNKYFASENSIPPVDVEDAEDVQDFFEGLDRILASRCMGLLETSWRLTQQQPRTKHQNMFVPKIEFLHRTVKDFLMTKPAQTLLQNYSTEGFDSHLFRLNLLLVDLGTGLVDGPSSFHHEQLLCFLRHMQQRQDPREGLFFLFERITEVMKRCHSQPEGYKGSSGCTHEVVAEFLQYQSLRHDSALTLAMQLGWRPYVDWKFTCDEVAAKCCRPLLDYALRPCLRKPQNPDPWIIEKIVTAGGNCGAYEGSESPLWVKFLVTVQFIDKMDYEACLNTLKTISRSGPLPTVGQKALFNTFGTIAFETGNSISGPRYTHANEAQKRDAASVTAHACLKPRLSQYYPEMELLPVTERDYTFMQLLRCLSPVNGPKRGVVLFEEADIVDLEHLITQRDFLSPVPDQAGSVGSQPAPTPKEGLKKHKMVDEAVVDGISTKRQRRTSF